MSTPSSGPASGYGIDPWGSGPWGGATAEFSIVRAYANSETSVVVVLSNAPQAINGFLTHDALNPLTWWIGTGDLVDLGFSKTAGPGPGDSIEAYTIVGVRPWNPPYEWELRIVGTRFPGSPTVLWVGEWDLFSALGSPTVAPHSASFVGVQWQATATPDGISAERGHARRDIANLPTPSIEQVGGTFNIAGGDYTLEDGAALVKKLILRRCIATPGDFSHLPLYGAGFKPKKLLPVAALVTAQADLRRHILREPEVDAATVRIVQAGAALVAKISVRLRKTGQQVDVSLPFPFAA